MHRFSLLVALVSCGPAAPQLVAPGAAGLPPLLAGLRDATGGAAWERVQVIEEQGAIEVGGLTGTIASTEDVVRGRHRTAIHIGAIDQADGFDGAAAWEQTPGGEIIVPDAPEARQRVRTEAWMTGRDLFHAGGARYRDLGTTGSNPRLRGLEATPEAGAPIELWFDATGLLARTVSKEGRKMITSDFSDWREVGGVRLPFRSVIDQGDPRNLVTVTLSEVHLAAAVADTTFARPTLDADRLSFAGGARTSTLPFELINNHIYIHASVDGKPVRLLVDTGGINMLTPASAKRLGVTSEGTMAASGVGADQVDMGIAHAGALTIGDVTLAHPIFYVIEIGALADVEGVDFDGLVGFEMFARLAVRIDYPGRTLTLTTPAAFTPPTRAIAVPFDMADRTPIIRGAIDGVPGRFWIDTGSRSSLTTMAKFTRVHDLEGHYHPRFKTVTGWGVGGPSSGAPVRVHEVTLGGAVVHDVVVDLFTGDKGAMADPDAAANLGGGILHRFIVSFDYAKKTMYLEPGKDVDARETYDRSGVFLLRDGAALKIGAVTPTGPAEQSGLRAGDRVTSIDGSKIETHSLPDWRAYLRDRAPGTKVVLRVERVGGAANDIAITLAELVP